MKQSLEIKKISLQTISKDLSRNEMRVIKAGYNIEPSFNSEDDGSCSGSCNGRGTCKTSGSYCYCDSGMGGC